MLARHKESGKILYVVTSRKSYGGVTVYECVTLETATKFFYKIPPYITGMYFEGSLELIKI